MNSLKGAFAAIVVTLSSSFRRKPESTVAATSPMWWTPAFAGVTKVLWAMVLCVGLSAALSFDARAASSDGDIPTVAQPRPAITDMWREARQGMPGVVVSQPEARGVLIQSEGELWRDLRNGVVAYWGALAMGGVAGAIAVFYLLRGPIRMEGGPSGRTILRFKTVERVGHWMTAGSFLVLAFTGLNILFGRWAIEPWLGKEAFAAITMAGKWLHNIGGLFFMVGLLMIFVMWSKENLWDRYDLNWILQGGGLLFKGKHPPAAKFNFGQKTQYWMVILVGAAVSYTGVNLLFPFMFFGMQGMQLLHIAHVALAIVMILFMLGHIYIGTIGMEGAADAMTSGFVDEKWAEEHHAAWVAEERAKAGKTGGMKAHPAE